MGGGQEGGGTALPRPTTLWPRQLMPADFDETLPLTAPPAPHRVAPGPKPSHDLEPRYPPAEIPSRPPRPLGPRPPPAPGRHPPRSDPTDDRFLVLLPTGDQPPGHRRVRRAPGNAQRH